MERPAAEQHRGQGVISVAIVAIVVAVGFAPAGPVTGEAPPAGAASVQRVEAALLRKEYSVALKAANEVYSAALASRRWDGMVAAGDAYHRIGEATGFRTSFDAKAREAYLTALFRARQVGSLDGVLRVAEAFLILGDAEVVAQCVRIAELLAAQDPDAQADVRAFIARLADPTLSVRQLRP
jgi:hypothetical protein